MVTDESETVKKARDILRGKSATPKELLKLANGLKKEKAFTLARRILAIARRAPGINDDKKLLLKIIQQHALCTYKDTDLPVDSRLDRALEILKETGEDLNQTKNQETLGLAGAIHKRKWEVDSQKQHLERSLAYYRRGYEGAGGDPDYGYTAINTAFLLDLLADQEEAEAIRAGTVSESAESRRREARRIREEIVSTLTELAKQPGNKLSEEWWFLVTVAEAYFGLERYEEVRPWLEKAAALRLIKDGDQPRVPDWEFESTVRQLAAIALLREKSLPRQLATLAGLYDGSSKEETKLEGSPAWRVLEESLGINRAGLRTAFIGKVGLGLSGGGFRASLFHIGVLARLAELDVLRSVEVLSCVSGGSIIGAHYYLEVRKLLQKTKRDDEITREDYIEVVKRVERDFLAGVQKNIRTRVAAEWLTNLKMIFLPNYSRTQRVGELYEKEIFSKVEDGEGDKERWLNDLFIRPLGEPDSFAPKNDNWRRTAKVPILILNAATLNTGHNWHFTASYMGEPPAGINTEIDANDFLRRMYYPEAPEEHRKVRLGYAVAASSCVPGLFEPLILANLYPERTVRLVDGGVHDNQGVGGLLEQDCTVLLVSDASGQMESQTNPSAGLLGVPLRTLDVLMARVRGAQYQELSARRRSSHARGLMFIHLKKDLNVDPVDWVDCQDPFEASDEARPPERRGVMTQYGIPKDIQRLLAAVRTDLDSFSDKEAYALMTSGYRMTEREFPHTIQGFSSPPGDQTKWRFLDIEKAMNQGAGTEKEHRDLIRLLGVSKHKAFKIWRLSLPLKIIAGLLGVTAFLGLAWLSWKLWSKPLLTVSMVVSAVLWVVLGLFVGSTIVRIVNCRKTLTQIGIGIGMALLGFIAARIHLHLFDKWYLKLGRINPEPESTAPPNGTVSR